MMMRRAMRRGPGLGPVATVAVVAGTAHHVAGKQQQKAANQQAAAQQDAQMDQMAQQQAAQQQQIEQMQAQQAAPPPAAPAAAPANDLTAQLNQLAQLHTSGVLTDEEFSAAKQKLLSGG